MKPLFACLLLACALASPTMAASVQGCGGEAEDVRSGAGAPRTPSMAAITACTKIASPEKRLDCYDALTGHSD